MTGHEDKHEDVVLKVVDRRKFNPDGSLKEGVELDKDTARAAEPRPEPVAAQPSDAAMPKHEASKTPGHQTDSNSDEIDNDEEMPGADEPASFVNFLSTLATNAAASLGAVPHPATGKRSLDLDTGKYWLDVLAMIRDKTKGNLHPKEDRLLEGLLADLRLQYVQLVRATEEKLKAQAAQQFSGADILGKK